MTDLHESLQAGGLVLADFMLPECSWCNLMTPAIDDLARTYQDLKVVKVNLKEQPPKLGETFKINALPTLILFKDGKQIGRLEGLQPFHVLSDFVRGNNGNLVRSD